MKFSIKDPKDDTPLLLRVVPITHEGEQALKIVFPETDSITMIKKNGLWINAGQTDVRPELVKAISRGIQFYIESNIRQQQTSYKTD